MCIRDRTGAGQHGVATATAAALMGMECVVFMGEEDTVRQALNVYRMRLLGAEVIPVRTGTATLKDAVSEAMREWTSRILSLIHISFLCFRRLQYAVYKMLAAHCAPDIEIESS